MPADGYWPLAAVVVCAAAALWTRAVSRTGAWTGGLVGLVISAGAGWPGFAMLFVLLAVGTAVSPPTRRGRGALQVICNSGVAAVAALAAGLGATWGLVATAGALSTALSDTAAGEIGRRLGRAPRALLFGPRVPVGTDGGMSWSGTLAGVVGALLVPVAGVAVGAGFDLHVIALLAAAGFAGNLCDSVLGVTVQARLGPWGNDWTNLAATTGGAVLAVVLV